MKLNIFSQNYFRADGTFHPYKENLITKYGRVQTARIVKTTRLGFNLLVNSLTSPNYPTDYRIWLNTSQSRRKGQYI